ncbi:MAG: hypothetical protein IVW57_06420 [Ktedonobacterales bacterium]|nr:hypothetical protein [Ktedonobacterales bacterium]
MDLIVIGGGCYGCLHTRQLLKARRRDKIACRRLIVVDRNPVCRARTEFAGEPLVEIVQAEWGAFLRAYLDTLDPQTENRLVPAPFAPHLLFEWLLSAARSDTPRAAVRRGACALPLGLPFERQDDQGNQFISAAGWLCPATCIEPALCPAIKGARTWELGDIVRAGVARAPTAYTDTLLFTCRHFAWGVGTIPLRAPLEARARLATALAAGQPQRVIVGTVSSCHGVLGLLEAAPPPAASAP